MGLRDDAAETPVAYGPNPGRDHPDILSDGDALHARCEMARRVGFAKAELREAIQYLQDGEGSYWVERACRRALEMLETGATK